MRKPDSPSFAWLQLPATLDALEVVRSFISQKAHQVSFPSEAFYKVELVLEELLVNVISYAYSSEQAGIVEVGCGISGEDWFCVQIRDQGRPFNPLSLASPDLTTDIPNRQIGGLGVYFVLQMVHDVNYERRDEWNEFTFCFHLSELGGT